MKKKDFYVYIHRRKSDGVVFYVGKGRLNRAYDNHRRSGGWLKNSINGYDVEFYKTNLSNQEAIDLENYLLDNTPEEWELCNIQNSCDVHQLDSELIKSLFYYDETSPTSIRWKVSNGQTNHSKRSPGDPAGYHSHTSTKYKRFKVGVKGKEVMVHRVVCILHGLDVPKDMVVNHIDGDPSNNKISNLEVVSQRDNSRRQKRHIRGISDKSNTGHTGVTRTVVKTGQRYYFAHWRDINHDTKGINFSIDLLGEEEALRLAVECRKGQIERVNREIKELENAKQ